MANIHTNAALAIDAAINALEMASHALEHPDNRAETMAAADGLRSINFEAVVVEAIALVAASFAEASGRVLTIEQRPRAPLAMGNYDTVVSVRPKRMREQS